MPTQLETVVAALKAADKHLTADELAVFLKAAGAKAENPQNSVASLVSRNPDLFKVEKDGGVVRYSLVDGSQGPICSSGVSEAGSDRFGAFRGLCRQMAKVSKFCASEADVREKAVLPFLRDWLGYDAVPDMAFEPTLNCEGKERPDIVVHKGKKRLFVVEIKRLGADLPKAEAQLKRYFRMADGSPLHLGILTDGLSWRFYLREMKAGTVVASLYAVGSVVKPDMAFLDAVEDLRKDGFSLEIARNNARAWLEFLK